MSDDHTLSALADLCGIEPTYHDLQGVERPTSPDTLRALVAANGFDVSSEAAMRDALDDLRHRRDDRWFPEEIIVESGVSHPLSFGLGAEWYLCLDGDDAVQAEGQPADHITLPPLRSGVYVLTATASGRTETVTVLAAPRSLPSVSDLTGQGRLWGLNLALYGLRSARNAGLGDFADLANAAEIAGQSGAGFLGINPLHNMGFSDQEAISPYSPSDRGFLNTAYIALDAVPDVAACDLSALQALRDTDTVQYAAHKQAHTATLENLYRRFREGAGDAAKQGFEAFKAARGSGLAGFARFEALSERNGADWRDWPARQTAPDPARADFHLWLQWVADTQLAEAQARAKASGMSLGLYLDLAVGPRRDGGESWREQSAIARGVSIGAPPDHLSPAGQNWNLAAFAPAQMKAQRYAPLRRVLAQTMRHAGIIRIDHVLGLNRSFWIPDDGSPGAYIRQPFEALMAVIKIEAERNNCAVIGEDLGLVPHGFRDTMRAHGFYGYSVMQYEKQPDGTFPRPQDSPHQVLSCFATHDTPTLRGYACGRDIDWWERLDWIDAGQAREMKVQRLQEVSAQSADGDFGAMVHTRLAASNADLVAVQLDDMLDTVEAQNLPGTIDEHPNWRRKYIATLEELPDNPGLQGTARIMNDAGRGNTQEET
ncbi:4-alpha-glucanotransferase [Primorskyibacter aestuariivivens]|uniref:4-alpha-glucanotransferase n=1 Tax=Primorskyibacter aestuariivivens TaxID=1888912 RepID=UPI0023003C3E|nr:4-alpha-glucanotransferase [Primorskyibacter aestuariivivens]MDA7427577.1 4-alpha-glucanotransferase [Primorskyibacter aestuariivivens]